MKSEAVDPAFEFYIRRALMQPNLVTQMECDH